MSHKLCPHCDHEILESALRCKHCKQPVAGPDQIKRCPVCNAQLFHTIETCNVCGFRYGEDDPAAAAPRTRRISLKTARSTAPEQPFSVAGVLADTARVCASNLGTSLLLVLLALAPLLLWTVHGALELRAGVKLSAAHTLVQRLLALTCLPLAAGALSASVFMRLARRETSLGRSLIAGISSLFRVLLISLFSGLAIGAGALPGMLYLIFAEGSSLPGLALTATGGLVAWSITFLLIPCEVIERAGILGSLRRAGDLQFGRMRSVFLLVTILAGLQLGLGLGASRIWPPAPRRPGGVPLLSEALALLDERMAIDAERQRVDALRGKPEHRERTEALERRQEALRLREQSQAKRDRQMDQALKEYSKALDSYKRSLPLRTAGTLGLQALLAILLATAATVTYVHLRRALEGIEPEEMVSVFP